MNPKNPIKSCRCKLCIGIATSSLQIIHIPYRQRFWRTGLLAVDILHSIYMGIKTVILLQNISKISYKSGFRRISNVIQKRSLTEMRCA